jgi:DNA-binding NarL/FixJ family response regulator
MADRGTILVVDNDDATRAAAVQVALQFGCGVSAAENAELLLEHLDGHRPALVLVEVDLSGPTNGLELLRELHERFGDDLPVILLSGDRTNALDRVAGLMLGADDYIVKPFDTGELLARIRRSLRRAGGHRGSGNGKKGPTGSENGNSRPASDVNLSPREREILTLLAEGRSQSEIAASLVISPKTVATHIQHLLSKLGAHSRAQAVAFAFQLGLVDPDVRAHALVLEPS